MNSISLTISKFHELAFVINSSVTRSDQLMSSYCAVEKQN